MKTIFPLIVLIFLVGLSLYAYTYDREQVAEIPQEQRETLVANHIKENISALSPESEVLGGTFYVTNIEFNSANTGTVEYEDGHIALVADLAYSIDGAGNVEVELTNVREHRP